MAKCSLCENLLVEGGRDVHSFNKVYELPFEIKWNGTNCNITNKVVNSICSKCLGKIMDTVKECMRNDEAIEEDEKTEEFESIWF